MLAQNDHYICAGFYRPEAAVQSPVSVPAGVRGEPSGAGAHRLQHWSHPPRRRGVRYFTQV